MLKTLKNWHNRRQLNAEKYAFLFDEAPDEDLICFDCETSHLNPKKAEILSIGAVNHHLRHCDLENGLQVEEAILCFLYFIGSRPLVGYYLEFDVAMINKYLKPLLGISLPNEQVDVSGLYYDYKQNVFNPIPINLRFDAILKDLDLPVFGQHDALNDALMTAMMYIKLQNI
ncbi:hypothetical protein PN36_24355 [Candidatus Thiomargarita nelsonii]|uniref:Exonuclease domain-containing protein n=1 Tax=Candidatus Thiomargarita nelsonii TaxID=1003181 RepID=A0A0A6PKB2_9GAMM|nr:hypothetical protein PN36_24355 [Candidatus Thiomargarita nelsonii]